MLTEGIMKCDVLLTNGIKIFLAVNLQNPIAVLLADHQAVLNGSMPQPGNMIRCLVASEAKVRGGG